MANDILCDFRKYTFMKNQNVKHAKWVAAEFARTGKSKGGLAEALGINSAGVTRLLKANRNLKADEIQVIQNYFNGEGDGPASTFPDAIPEIAVRGGAGGGGTQIDFFSPDAMGGQTQADSIKENWGFPARFVRNQLGTKPSAIRIIEILGDSMEPALRSSDRVLVDVEHKEPSPPGIYAVWDGFGIVVKRIEIIPRSNPTMVRLISDNQHHAAYDVSMEDAQIVGRVICKISTM